MKTIDIKDVDSYFKGEAEKYIFALLYLTGHLKMQILGIEKIHYEDKEFAKIWRNKIMRELDKTKHPKELRALSELHIIYTEMVGGDE